MERDVEMSAHEEDLVIHFMPSLVEMLLFLERDKGATLTQEEVLDLRDNAIGITLRRSTKDKLDEAQGYVDLNPDRIWEEWCAYKSQGLE